MSPANGDAQVCVARFALVIGLCLIAPVLSGQDLQSEVVRLRQENEELKARMARLEALVGSLLPKEKVETAVPKPAPEPVAVSPRVSPIEVYGSLRVTYTHDSNNSDLGNNMFGSPVWNSAALAVDSSILGVRFKRKGVWNGEASGVVEFDFRGGSAGSTNPIPRLRFAYGSIFWPQLGLGLLVGQTDDVIAPVSQDSISYPVESFTGDLGSRRPQIRLTQAFNMGRGVKAGIEAALAQASARIEDPTLPPDMQSPMLPVAQGRLFVSRAGATEQAMSLGLFASWGTKEFYRASQGEQIRLKTWSTGLDARVPIGRYFFLQGEVWRGIIMDLYRLDPAASNVGSAQSVTAGGWAGVTVTPTRRWRANFGAGFDQPQSRTPDSTSKDLAHSWFGNVFYMFNGNLEAGVEYSRWTSTLPDSDSVTQKNRIQLRLLYGF